MLSTSESTEPPMATRQETPLRVVASRPIVNTIRQLLYSVTIFITLFLFVRTFFLEPFGVPTGSMATSFLGNHRECDCPRCGYRVVVGEPGPNEHNTLAGATCPNCGERKIDLTTAREIPGDRLMVDKNVFQARKPRRWEVAVFRCPVDDSKPYVKRVVGLPGEAVQIVQGDILANGELQRKTLAECREVWIPVFDQAHAPPGGWGPRWLVRNIADPPRLPKIAIDTTAGPEILQGSDIVLDATTETTPVLGLTYRHWNLDLNHEQGISDWLAYNGAARRQGAAVHDFAVTFDLEVTAGRGSFALRLQDGGASAFVDFPVATDEPARLSRDGGDTPAQYAVQLQPGKTYRIEYALFDRRAHVSVDGTLFGTGLDLPATRTDLTTRESVSHPVQMGVKGVRVVLHNFKIYRDVHYRSDGNNGVASAFQLGTESYFLLGDNSNNSHDSREWAIAGVPERDFLGKPFLIHQPLRLGRMTVGGQERTYQAIDWPRLRWVR
ncbi:hypothetical protein BH11PLA2_BH11PLA2_39060 [soil metagenome]